MTERLPTPGADFDTWGEILNGYLHVSHNDDGTENWGEWRSYLKGGGNFTRETLLSVTGAPSVVVPSGWLHTGYGPLTTQPILANSLVYFGSFDGWIRAVPAARLLGNGWATHLGATTTSSPSIGEIDGKPVIYVAGGGDNDAEQAYLYALNALTGTTIWQTPLGSPPGATAYDAPRLHAGAVYIGVSSVSDSPLVQGLLVKIDAASGAILATFKVVPDGSTGGGIWGSPTIDEEAGALYATTGNPGAGPGQENTFSILKLAVSDLTLLDGWQAPVGGDSDFGSTPTLFEGTVSVGGTLRKLVGAPNKNGHFYVLDRSDLASGPLASLVIADGGDDPTSGGGSISPGAWDGETLYLSGGNLTTSSGGPATLQTALGVANADLLYTAKTSGPAGNGITIEYGMLGQDFPSDGSGASSQALDLSADSSLTLAFWLKTEDTGDNNATAFTLESANVLILPTYGTPGHMHIRNDPGGDFEFASVPVGEWHHFIIELRRIDGEPNGKVWIDGSLAATGNPGGAGSYVNDTLDVMSRAGASYPAAGELAKLGLWHGTPLSDADKAALYSGGEPGDVHPADLALELYDDLDSFGVSVVSQAITVNLQLGTSSADDVKTGIDGTPAATALVSVAHAPGNDGSGLEPLMPPTNLSGGADPTVIPGNVYAFDPDDLSGPLWRTGLDGPVLGGVVVAPSLLAVGALSLYFLDAESGAIVQTKPGVTSAWPALAFWASPSIVDGTLYVGDTGGNLYAYTLRA